MLDREELVRQLEGKTEDEVRVLLKERYNISWDRYIGPCKAWYAMVFTYCNSSQLQSKLEDFLWIVNIFAPLFGFCFQEEDTVFLGCTCPCGHKQTVLYYTLTSTKY